MSMTVPLLDLKLQYRSIKSEIDAALMQVVETQQFILGPEVSRCEEAIARYCSCRHGVGVSSGTDALLICLMAEGIGHGDEVLTSAYSFFATAGSIARVGAKPVFVDISAETYNIDPSQIEAKVTRRTRAIIPVHLFGQTADMDPILEIARRHGLVVIEDAAQAIGAGYKGRKAGSLGDYGCFSFFPSKNLGCFGDGGMVTTNDGARAEKLAILRGHGAKPKYYHKLLGGNFRLDALQAAVVRAKLPHLDSWSDARGRNARLYEQLLKEAGLLASGKLSPPKTVTDRHVFNQYVVRAADRDALRKALAERGVGTEIYYPVPLHLQECFADLGHAVGDFPQSEVAAQSTLALPIFPELSRQQIETVVDAMTSFYAT